MQLRIGFGYDSHRFQDGNFLRIGGVDIPYTKSFTAHSDGDLLIHALCDALLGAASLKDIGTHFPDNEPKYHNISSLVLLQETAVLLANEGWSINNVDLTVVLEKPKLVPYIDAMIAHLSSTLNIAASQLSIKAKTNEKMGFIGHEEGAAAFAVVTITR